MIYKLIILFVASAAINFSSIAAPKPLVNICLDKIYENLTKNTPKQDFINQLDTLPEELKFNIKQMLIDRNIAKIWHLFSKKISKTALVGHQGKVNAIAISNDTNFIVTATDDTTACIWRHGNCTRLIGHNGSINCVAISCDNRYVATGSSDNGARLWDATTGKCLAQFVGHTDSINSVDISTNNSFIVTGSSDNTARIWNKNGLCIGQLFGHTRKINDVALLPDNKIITGSDDKTVRVWDNQGNFVKLFRHKGRIIKILKLAPDFFLIKEPSGFEYYKYYQCGAFKRLENSEILSSLMTWKFSADSSFIIEKMNRNITIIASDDYEALNASELKFIKINAESLNKSEITVIEISSDLNFIVAGYENDVMYMFSIRPKIEQLLSPETSIADLISMLGLTTSSLKSNGNNSNCAVS